MNKISYALGLGIGHQLKSMNIEDFSVEDFAKSIGDVMSGKETAMTSQEAQMMLNEYFQKKEKEQAQTAIAEGKVYLEENAKRDGVTHQERPAVRDSDRRNRQEPQGYRYRPLPLRRPPVGRYCV